MPPFIDAHAHLDRFPDAASAIASAKGAGCEAIVTCGYEPAANRAAVALARANPGFVFPAIGLAPGAVMDWSAEDFEREFASVRENASSAVAIGEIGLDYHWAGKHEQIAAQKEYFSRQLAFAVERDMPVVIHSRKAEADALAMLKDAGARKVLLHFFSGPPALAREAAALGYSFTVPPTRSRSRAASIREMPLPSLMLESDSPYVGATPETALEAGKIVAESKGISIDEVVTASAVNAKRFFGLKPGGSP